MSDINPFVGAGGISAGLTIGSYVLYKVIRYLKNKHFHSRCDDIDIDIEISQHQATAPVLSPTHRSPAHKPITSVENPNIISV
jgi:hypothetical protein